MGHLTHTRTIQAYLKSGVYRFNNDYDFVFISIMYNEIIAVIQLL